jgi:hypothetical protein
MKIRKSFAGVAAGSLALAGLAVVTAPSASAATGGPYTLNGSPQNQAGTAAYVGTPSVTLTATQAGANVNIVANISVGPTTTSFAGFAAGSYRLDAYVSIDGGPQVQLTGTDPSLNPAVPPSTASFPAGTTATATVSGLTVGAHSIVLQSLVAEGNGASSGGGFATNFSEVAGFDAVYNLGTTTATIVADPPASPIGLTETITVTGPSANATGSTYLGADGIFGTADDVALASGTPYVRTGDAITVTGNNFWGANVPASNFGVTVCGSPAVLATCAPIVAGSAVAQGAGLSTTGNQLSSATYKVALAANTGVLYLRIGEYAAPVNPATSVGSSVRAAYIPFNGLGAPTVSATQGVNATLGGSFWYPGETVALSGGSGSPASVTASATGTLSGVYTWSGVGTPTLTATSGINSTLTATATLSALIQSCDIADPGDCNTNQQINATVDAGSLAQAALGTVINLGAVPVAPIAQSLTGDIYQIEVSDLRGAQDSFSLTASMPDFTGPAALAASNLSIANIACVATTTTAAGEQVGDTGITEGGDGNFGGSTVVGAALTICDSTGITPNAAGTTGGVWNVDADLALNIPAFQAAGDYQSTITFLLA